MKNALLISCIVLSACERGLADKQAELASIQRDEQELARRLDLLTLQTTKLKNQFEAESSRLRRVNVALREQQISAVEKWRGKRDVLDGMLSKRTLPPVLLASLKEAQRVAGGESIEARFARAVKDDSPEAIASLIDGWERHWIDAWDPAPEEEPAKVCPTTRSLSCTGIDDDALWCPDGEQRVAWAMLLENGALTVAQLQGGTRHTVEARLAPKVWLTRVGTVDDGMLVVSDVRGSQFAMRWSSEVKKGEKRLETVKANFDEDPFTEALFWIDDELTLIDPNDTDTSGVFKNETACRALEVVDGVPRPVKDLCLKSYWKKPELDAGTR
ncbi:MAG: hypothetical protein ACO1OB_23875 [Archangium sp.]